MSFFMLLALFTLLLPQCDFHRYGYWPSAVIGVVMLGCITALFLGWL